MFKKTAIGLDISDRTIEIIKLSKSGTNIKVVAQGREILPSGVVKNGIVRYATELVKFIENAAKSAKLNLDKEPEVCFILPESQIYSQIISINKKELGNSKTEEILNRKIAQNIPLEQADIAYNYKLLTKNSDGEDYLIVAASKKVLQSWQDLFDQAKLKIDFFDLETLAGIRAVFNQLPKEPTCLLDIGAQTSHIAVVDKTGLCYDYSIFFAGREITKSIAKQLKVSQKEAEKQKKKASVSSDTPTGEIIRQAIEPLTKELQEFFDYYQNKYTIKIAQLVIIGGTAKLKGLEKHLSSQLNTPTVIGQSDILNDNTSLIYLGAIGAALRSLSNKHNNNDLKIGLVKSEKVKKIKEEKIEDEIEKTPATKHSNSNIKLIILLLILVLGGVGVFGAYYYRSSQKNEANDAKSQNSLIEQFNNTEIVSLNVPITTTSEEYSENKIRGRIMPDAELDSAKQSLTADEVLWPTPVDTIEEINYWLVFSKADAQKNSIVLLKEQKDDFIFNNIELVSVNKTSESLYNLTVQLTITSTK